MAPFLEDVSLSFPSKSSLRSLFCLASVVTYLIEFVFGKASPYSSKLPLQLNLLPWGKISVPESNCLRSITVLILDYSP